MYGYLLLPWIFFSVVWWKKRQPEEPEVEEDLVKDKDE
jgi:hypothetical protein